MGGFVLVEDVAETLNMTPAAVRALIRREELPAYKLGKEWRIKKDDLMKFIASSKLKTAAEVAEEVRRSKLQESGGGAIDVKLALDKISEVVHDMANQDARERLVSYSVIRSILTGLDEVVAKEEIPIGNYIIYKHELIWSCGAVSGLNDGNGHDAGQHIPWALGAVSKLKSFHCFNTDNIKPIE